MYTEDVARLYDLEHAGFEEDLHLYQSYALMTGGPVLELGCGTGRLMLPLVAAGYEVVGVDSSPGMLRLARERLQSAGQRDWDLLCADLADLGSLRAEHFGMAFCALNTWAHLAGPEEAVRVLEAVHRVLRPAGLLLIDVEDPVHRVAGRGELLLGGVFSDGDATVVKIVASAHDPSSGADDVTVIWDRTANGGIERTVAHTRMRSYSRGELEQMLLRTGYEVRETLGSWDLEAYTGRGDRLVFVASRL